MKIEFYRYLADNLDCLDISDNVKELSRFNDMQQDQNEIFKQITDEVIKRIEKGINWIIEDTPDGYQKITGVLHIQISPQNV